MIAIPLCVAFVILCTDYKYKRQIMYLAMLLMTLLQHFQFTYIATSVEVSYADDEYLTQVTTSEHFEMYETIRRVMILYSHDARMGRTR